MLLLSFKKYVQRPLKCGFFGNLYYLRVIVLQICINNLQRRRK